jgi:hypothetical protein
MSFIATPHLVALAGIISLAACSGSSSNAGVQTSSSLAPLASTAASTAPAAPTPMADPFVYAAVTERPATVPARFGAKLVLGKESWPAESPPPSYVRDAICSGEGSMRARFLEALEAAAPRAKSLEALEPYVDFVKYCSEESRCEWSAEVTKSSRPLLVRQVVWHALAGCSERFDEYFDQEDAPIQATLDHLMTRSFSSEKWTAPKRPWKKLVALALAGESTGKVPGTHFGVSAILRRLAVAGDETVRDFILKRHGRTTGPAKGRYAEAACALHESHAEARRVCLAWCASPENAGELQCTQLSATRSAWPGDLSAAACDPRHETFRRLAEEYPTKKQELADAIARCLEGPTIEPRSPEVGRLVVSRLTMLANIDFARANAVSQKLASRLGPPSDQDPGPYRLRQAVHFHARYASRQAALESLRGMGFELRPQADERWTTGEDLLGSSVHAVHFDPETGQWPNEHDHLARQLSRPIAKAMQGVMFEELAEENEAGVSSYQLRAYFDGVVFEVAPADNGDWYDVPAVVGLVNAVLKRRGAKERVAITSLWGNDATVIAAQGAAIARAREEGWLELVDGGNAVDQAIKQEKELLREVLKQPR